jgi:hypothetical protein
MKEKIKQILIKAGYSSRPDFMIIGAQKAGTTSLYNMLTQHSLIIGSNTKEVHFFDNDQWYSEKKLYQYHSFFPLPYKVPDGAKLFEATPMYLFHPEVAIRLHSYNPNLKFIILLRNPAERAFSAWTMYHHHFKSGSYKHLHDPRSFSTAIAEELEKFEETSYYDNRISYVKRGIYHFQIEAFLKYFPKSNMLIIENEELKDQQQESSKRIQSFVNVPYENLKLIELNKSRINETIDYKNEILNLQKFYNPHNSKLFQLIGREFNWNETAVSLFY